MFRGNSFNNKNFFYYPECNHIDMKEIVLSAKNGLQQNKSYSLTKRKKYIYEIYKEIIKNYKILAKYESLETGKNILDAEKEILHSASIWLYASKCIKNLKM